MLIAGGFMPEAASLLGRPYALDARVVPGDRRGTLLGYPTANLHVRGQLLPKDGVYAAITSLGPKKYSAIVNVGLRPTFDGMTRVVEAHLLDVEPAVLYGKRMEVGFIERIRDEMKFSDGRALGLQIKRDIETARTILAHISSFNEVGLKK
jgi:riboflavin kinase/FMN adenylyltransferase